MFDIIASEFAAIFLFFYSIHRFSKMIIRFNTQSLHQKMKKMTKYPIRSFMLGIVSSAFIQSNKAVSSIALTLVNTGIVKGIKVVPIIFGAIIGVSSTAFLVSCKMQSMEELLIILGAFLRKTKYKKIGHIIFYLGLMMFSLELMTNATSSLKSNPAFQNIFSITNNVFLLFIIGVMSSFLLQSGALVISILTILVSYGTLTLNNAVSLSVGVTVGSTLSLIIVTLPMNIEAKKACFIGVILNFISAVINIFLSPLIAKIGVLFNNPDISFAVANLCLRCSISICSLLLFCIYKQWCHKFSKSLTKLEETFNVKHKDQLF